MPKNLVERSDRSWNGFGSLQRVSFEAAAFSEDSKILQGTIFKKKDTAPTTAPTSVARDNNFEKFGVTLVLILFFLLF